MRGGVGLSPSIGSQRISSRNRKKRLHRQREDSSQQRAWPHQNKASRLEEREREREGELCGRGSAITEHVLYRFT